LARIRKDFTIGAESRGEVLFTGQRIRWQGTALTVDQDKAIDELEEVPIARGLPDSQPCTPQQHTAFRNISGSLNWFQSRTQFQIGYKFSRAASAAAAPQIKDLRAVNKIVRAVKAAPQRLFFWPNNEDNSSQRGQVILLPNLGSLYRGTARVVKRETARVVIMAGGALLITSPLRSVVQP
jgi:hypothetical protein